MKDELTCEIVRDLLPALNEGLTSEKTTRWAMEHLDTCPECKEKYDVLHAVDPAELNRPSAKEMDRDVKYLKKVKKKTLFTILVAVICSCSILFAGYYFLFEKKYYVPVDAMNVVLDLDFPDTNGYFDITLQGAYAVAVREKDEILYIKDSENSNRFDLSLSYSYHLWDYLFANQNARTEKVIISSNFVGDEYPGMTLLNTPARIILKGTSDADSKVLWSSVKILPAVQAIYDRFIDSYDSYDPTQTARLKAVSETTEIILGPLGNTLGFGIPYEIVDGTASEWMLLHDIYILVRNLDLSDNDLDTLKESAVLYAYTTKTTAAVLANNDVNAPDEEVLVRRLGLYVLPDVEMEAEPLIHTFYIGMGYSFYQNEGAWFFEKAEGTVNHNEGDYYVLPINERG